MANYHTGQKSYMSGAGAARRVEDKARSAFVAEVKLRAARRACSQIGVTLPPGAENVPDYVYGIVEAASWYWDRDSLCWRDGLSCNVVG
jgi:hypothetical protein